MNKVQKIREKIAKKLEVMQYQVHRKDAYKELKSILDYTDSLQKEPVSKEIGDYDHKAVMEALHPELKEEPVSEDLEEAASNYAEEHRIALMDYETGEIEMNKSLDVVNAFKAGAQWQKEQDVKKIETAIDFSFHGGRCQKEEEMLKNAIDATCFGFQGDALFSFKLPADKYLVGSKVKVIVINED